MAEELQDASKTLPRSMIIGTVVNGGLGWVMVITLCFCLGDLDSVLSSPTGMPFIQVFLNATGSTAAATAMTVFVLIPMVVSNLSAVSTASRQCFAFARDAGLPFSPWLSKVTRDVPLNAILVTFFTTSLLSLINIGSSAALNSSKLFPHSLPGSSRPSVSVRRCDGRNACACSDTRIVTSLGMVAFLSSYLCSIGCVAWRRTTNEPLPRAAFSLGRLGLLINIISLGFLAPMLILSFFPMAPNPTPVTMNWSVLIYGAVILIAFAYYVARGRHQYVGPVEYVRKVE